MMEASKVVNWITFQLCNSLTHVLLIEMRLLVMQVVMRANSLQVASSIRELLMDLRTFEHAAQSQTDNADRVAFIQQHISDCKSKLKAD